MYKRTTTDSKAKNTSKQERLENLEKLVPNGKKKWVRYDEGAVLYSMGYHSFRKLAQDAKAVYRINRIVLVNTEKLDEYIELMCADEVDY